MRSLSLDQLRTLQTVVETGGFTAAARRLHLSQSAVSTQVQELEDRLGVRLVERLGKKAYATAAGREVIERARRIADETDDIVTATRRFRDGWVGRVQVGTGLTALMYLLPPALKKIRTEHPGIELLVRNITTRAIVDAVLQNTIDLGVVTLPIEEPNLRITPLYEERLVAILPRDMRNSPREITPDFLAGQSLILEPGAIQGLVLDWLSVSASAPRPAMVIGTVEAIKTLVAAGLGVSVIPEVAVAKPSRDLIVRPLSPPLGRTLALIQHRNKPDDTALKIVRDAILAGAK
ncbi:MAG: LysR family transcriptional regulator [Hyphomicrobiaceae bacterium]